MDLATPPSLRRVSERSRTAVLDAPIRDPRELSFDQYARHRLVAELCRRLLEPERAAHVLDVGGRTGLLGRFVDGVRITPLDLELGPASGLVRGDGARLPFRSRAFDAVVSCDTLEHVADDRRADFVAECCRASRGLVLLTCPFRAPRVEEAERALAALVRSATAAPHRYLEEHRRLGLPERAEVEAWFRAAGLEVHAMGHGNLDRWLALLSLSLYMDSDPHLRSVARLYYRFYNESLFEYDHEPPHYRHVLVACTPGTIDPERLALFGERRPPPGGAASFEQVLSELVGFHRERDVYEAERARLAEVNDGILRELEAHKRISDDLRAERERILAELDSTWKLTVQMNDKLVAHVAEIERLRAQLRSRKRSFLRAFAWNKASG